MAAEARWIIRRLVGVTGTLRNLVVGLRCVKRVVCHRRVLEKVVDFLIAGALS